MPENSLSAVLGEVRAAVDRLRAAALNPFPLPQRPPRNGTAVVQAAREVMAWVARLAVAFGWTRDRAAPDPPGLLCLFATGGPWMRPNLLLGEPPPHLCVLGAHILFPAIAGGAAWGWDCPESERVADEEELALVVRNWPALVERWTAAHLYGRTRALLLVGWVEQQLAAYAEATLPRLVLTLPPREGDGRVTRTLAGVELPAVELPRKQAQRLRDLMASKELTMRRADAIALEAALELRGELLEALGSPVVERDGRPKKNSNMTRYRLAPAMAGRVKKKKK